MIHKKAGGFWVDPQGNRHEAPDGHNPFAYDILKNEMLSKVERKQVSLDQSGDVVQKGTGGAEALQEVEQQLGTKDEARDEDRNHGRHSNELRDKGWTQARLDGGKYQFFASTEDSFHSAWPHINQALNEAGTVMVNGQEISRQQLADDAERGAVELLRMLGQTASSGNAGLGVWGGTSQKRIRYMY